MGAGACEWEHLRVGAAMGNRQFEHLALAMGMEQEHLRVGAAMVGTGASGLS